MTVCTIDWPLVVTVLLALLGLVFWRVQLIAQRRFAVAEDAIVIFAMAKFALDRARNGGSFEGEGSTRQKGAYESEETTKVLNAYYTATERLLASEQIFADLEKTSLLARHHLGEDAFSACNTLLAARNRVFVSTVMLIQSYRERDIFSESTRKLWEQWQDDIRGGQIPESPLTKQVSEAHATLRAVCDREAKMTAAIWPFRFNKVLSR